MVQRKKLGNNKFFHFYYVLFIYLFLTFILAVGLSREERMVIVIGEIIQELLKANDEKKEVNINKIKSRISSKYALESQPRLVDIIAAVPQDAKKILLPKLRAKPIRTASGVSSNK